MDNPKHSLRTPLTLLLNIQNPSKNIKYYLCPSLLLLVFCCCYSQLRIKHGKKKRNIFEEKGSLGPSK